LQNYQITTRALITHNWKILLVKHKGSDYFSLPGWKLENTEKIKDSLKRELKEELWTDAKIWEVIFINEFIYKNSEKRTIEFFVKIENWEDFIWNIWKFAEKELQEIKWIWFDENVPIKPDFLKEKFSKLNISNWINVFSN